MRLFPYLKILVSRNPLRLDFHFSTKKKKKNVVNGLGNYMTTRNNTWRVILLSHTSKKVSGNQMEVITPMNYILNTLLYLLYSERFLIYQCDDLQYL